MFVAFKEEDLKMMLNLKQTVDHQRDQMKSTLRDNEEKQHELDAVILCFFFFFKRQKYGENIARDTSVIDLSMMTLYYHLTTSPPRPLESNRSVWGEDIDRDRNLSLLASGVALPSIGEREREGEGMLQLLLASIHHSIIQPTRLHHNARSNVEASQNRNSYDSIGERKREGEH